MPDSSGLFRTGNAVAGLFGYIKPLFLYQQIYQEYAVLPPLSEHKAVFQLSKYISGRSFRMSSKDSQKDRSTEKTFTGVYIDRATLDDIEASLPAADCRSRNEFIVKAVNHYLVSIRSDQISDLISASLEAVISARIKDTENRLARVIFKQSVEIAMLIHIICGFNHVPEDRIDSLRKMCSDQVSKLGGRYRLEDIVRFQNGE